MGQTVSLSTDAIGIRVQCRRRCCPAVYDSDRVQDTVVVDIARICGAPASPCQGDGATADTTRRRPQSRSSFACGLGISPGPQVQVKNMQPRSATVQWVYTTPEVNKFHVEVLQVPPEGSKTQVEPIEVAFFEADPSDRSLVLPPMTLERSSGPFVVQVTAEVGIDAMSTPGCSKPFSTPAEAPGEVFALRAVAPQAEREIRIEWDPPADDGGAPIEGYEVALCPGFVRYTTQDCCRTFGGLSPGSKGLWVEVRAKNAEGFLGPVSWITVTTAVGMPSQPTDLRARLTPDKPWTRGVAGPQGVLDSRYLKEGHDYDIIRLEFLGPDDTGGQEVDHFVVCAAEAHMPIASLSAAACMGKRAAGETRPHCVCNVPVAPNQTYSLSVVASNGVRASCPSAQAPPLFVPARVPAPPTEPPTVQYDPDVQLRVQWVSELSGGGLPLLSFKIGVIGPLQDSSDDRSRSCCVQLPASVQQELTAPIRDTICVDAASHAQLAADDVAGQKRFFTKDVTWLQPGASYMCVIAATNGVGTGQWSSASRPVRIPPAKPAAPRNLVATVTTDAQHNVIAMVAWDIVSDKGGEIVACSICLVPLQVSKVDDQNLDVDDMKRIRLEFANGLCTTRPECALQVPAPGRYRVEVFSESKTGNWSPPAILPLDVRQEAFPQKWVDCKPRWAKQPVFVLGTSEDEALPSLSEIRDDDCTYLHTLLLWEECSSERAFAPVDVVCFFRHHITGQPRVEILASSVSSSRLQAKLPARVPVALCLMRQPPDLSVPRPAIMQTTIRGPKACWDLDPLIVFLSDDCKHLTGQWQIWVRQCPRGEPPRWRALPDGLQGTVEAAWLQGRTDLLVEVSAFDSDSTGVSAGQYQVKFGNGVSMQHSVCKLGVDGWRANMRREVLCEEGDEADVEPSSVCVVCLERGRTHAFMHDDTGDGHLAVCGVCAEAFDAGWPCATAGACPVCRQSFSSLKRIFH